MIHIEPKYSYTGTKKLLKKNMNNQTFDLNDTENEPTDEQLHNLMNQVVIEARKKAGDAHKKLMDNLRKEISRVNQLQDDL